ncbi:MAG: RcpC/CpaB family pilus assembly protein [Clostridia bacterium]
MSFRLPAIHPVRLAGVVLLALALAYGAYTYLKPQTFAYAKLREGIVVEGGAVLQDEHVEKAVLPIGNLLTGKSAPVHGLIPFEEVRTYVGMPVTRRLGEGTPLLSTDFTAEKDGSEALQESMTGMTIPADNIVGVSPHLMIGDRVHLYASFEDEGGAHTGLLLREMKVIALQHEMESVEPKLSGVTIALKLDEAVLLTHALHYGKIHLGKASAYDQKGAGVGDAAFARALMRTKKKWNDGGEERP